jgi:isoquinoline 1-oxidoreductase beta subunit
MKFASVIRSPVYGGKLRSFDASAAKSVPGVRLVVPVHSGLAVIADDTWAALSGRRAVAPTIVWAEGANASISSADMLARLREADARGNARSLKRGAPVDATLAQAPRRIAAEYLYPFQAHAAMEPLAAVADVRPGRCEIWAGTQSPNAARQTAADVLGLDPSEVTLHVTLLGGGFGRRGQSDFVRDVAEASKAARAPVQVVWTREDDFQHDFYLPISIHRMSAGLDAGGRVVAWSHRAIGPSPARAGRRPESGEQLRKDLRGAYDVPYDFDAVSAEFVEAAAPVHVGFWRGVQHNPNVFASECFVDELALASRRDPLQYRLDHLRSGGTFPGGRDGAPVDRARLARTVAFVAGKSGWKSLAGPASGRHGRGIACNVHDGGTYVAVVADVSVDPSGEWRAERVVGGADCGIVVNPLGARAQMEGGVVWALSALSSEITLSQGRVEQSSFADFPILRMRDTPEIETHLVESGDPPTGMGEALNPACLAAVVNALSAATGRRLRTLPVRAEDLAGTPTAGAQAVI